MSILTSKMTFKKLATGAAILGLVAVPSFVGAQKHASADTDATTNTAVQAEGSKASAATTANAASTVSAKKANSNISADVSAEAAANVEGVTGGDNGNDNVPTSVHTTLSANVSFDAAIDIAQGKFTSKTVASATLMADQSTPVYLVTFSDGSKVAVDGTAGKITSSYDVTAKVTTGSLPLPLQNNGDGELINL